MVFCRAWFQIFLSLISEHRVNFAQGIDHHYSYCPLPWLVTYNNVTASGAACVLPMLLVVFITNGRVGVRSLTRIGAMHQSPGHHLTRGDVSRVEPRLHTYVIPSRG